MNPKSAKSADDLQCGTKTHSAQEPFIFPISELPPELFGLVLRFSLPGIDPMEWIWKRDECIPYITELYKLRRVSTTWRDTIDGNPSLWMVVSSSWPQEIIETALSRSAAGPLIVHHIPHAWPTNTYSFTRDFISLVNPHRSRWVAAVFAFTAQMLSEFTDAPIPRLDTLKLSLTGGTYRFGSDEFIPCPQTLVDVLTNLEQVHFNRLPFNWKEVIGLFTRLRTLMLTNMRHGITSDLLFQVIRNNPFLEQILLVGFEPDDESPRLWSPDPVLPPRLRIFRVTASVETLDNILNRIQFPLTLEALVVIATASSSHHDASLWVKMMSPMSTTIQRIHNRCGGSEIVLKDGAECSWKCSRKTSAGTTGFKLTIANMGPALALECFASLSDKLQLTKDLPGLSFVTESTYIEDAEVVAALVTIRALTDIRISAGVQNSGIVCFMDALGAANEDTKDNPVPFPSLRYLDLTEWKANIDGVIQAMKRRYSTGRAEVLRPRSGLQVDFAASKVGWFGDPEKPKAIISMDKIKELRDIVGVGHVWLGGSEKQPGMLAVVWSEEEGRELWG
ncbi:hypothetical protein FS837_008861 [Tulasnella sp. UAMH 9824]|nr:hypothetical protein FS837_008861 [Tulasnella sp. UAMH 9824]